MPNRIIRRLICSSFSFLSLHLYTHSLFCNLPFFPPSSLKGLFGEKRRCKRAQVAAAALAKCEAKKEWFEMVFVGTGGELKWRIGIPVHGRRDQNSPNLFFGWRPLGDMVRSRIRTLVRNERNILSANTNLFWPP